MLYLLHKSTFGSFIFDVCIVLIVFELPHSNLRQGIYSFLFPIHHLWLQSIDAPNNRISKVNYMKIAQISLVVKPNGERVSRISLGNYSSSLVTIIDDLIFLTGLFSFNLSIKLFKRSAGPLITMTSRQLVLVT
jgi:hypothetical protein